MKNTEDFVRDLRDYMRFRHIEPSVIKDEDEAQRLSRHDPLGKKWAVGDEYYELHPLTGPFVIVKP